MWWVIALIIVTILIICLAKKENSRKNLSSTENELIIGEILTYINSVKSLFVNKDHLNGETIGCLSIVPVNENKETFCPDSCKVVLHILLYDESDWRINSVLLIAKLNDSPFADFFSVEVFNGRKGFVAYPYGRFSGNYKSFMSTLFKEIDTVYPNKFRFNGSGIISVEDYGEKIF